jgi:hypothetical protein
MTQKAQSVGLSRSKIREAGGIGGPIFGFLAISGTLNELPSGKRLQFANYGKSPSLIGKSQLFLWAMFNSKLFVYQRVY